MHRVSIDRGRLHSGQPAIRVQDGKRFRFASEAHGGAFVLRPVKVRGKWLVYLYCLEIEAK